MSKIIVQNTCTLDDELGVAGGGTPRVGLEISVRKYPLQAWVAGGTVEKMKAQLVYTNDTGLWQVGLQPNIEIDDPTGSYYTVQEGRGGPIGAIIVPPASDPRVVDGACWYRPILEVGPFSPGDIVIGVTPQEFADYQALVSATYAVVAEPIGAAAQTTANAAVAAAAAAQAAAGAAMGLALVFGA